jgi:hypothetical protein
VELRGGFDPAAVPDVAAVGREDVGRRGDEDLPCRLALPARGTSHLPREARRRGVDTERILRPIAAQRDHPQVGRFIGGAQAGGQRGQGGGGTKQFQRGAAGQRVFHRIREIG